MGPLLPIIDLGNLQMKEQAHRRRASACSARISCACATPASLSAPATFWLEAQCELLGPPVPANEQYMVGQTDSFSWPADIRVRATAARRSGATGRSR